MLWILKLFDTELLKFSADPQKSEPGYKITWTNEQAKGLLPKDLELSEKGIENWIKHRNIPKNRAFVDAFLAKCGLSANRPLGIIQVSKGLSLNDCYWITDEDFNGDFGHCNLYDNRFSSLLSYIAFTGYGSSVRSTFTSSPEFTTNGMLPKCWRRIGGKITLYKGGTSGASNTGFEPYSEFYAHQIADALHIKSVPYGLSKWKGILCSTCGIFTSKDVAYIPIGRIVKEGGFNAVYRFYETLGSEYLHSLQDMIVLDAVIKNTDRHYGNFGLLFDSVSNTPIAPAPLFDHGNSLYNLAGLDSFDSEKALAEYDETLLPCVYDDFAEAAKKYMTNEHKKNLRSALDFTFKKHPRYNLPEKRLKLIEQQVKKNIMKLI